MKKLMVILLITLFPIFIFAKEIDVEEIKLKLDIDDSYTVLTRDNLKDNELLSKLNITSDNMEYIMQTNDIYLDIIKNDITYEILVVVPDTKVAIKNLSKENDEFIENLKGELIKQTGAETSSIYKNKYNFVVIEYYDKNTGYYIVNYYTVVDSRGYNFQLQKQSKITDTEKTDLKNIIDSVKFNIEEESKPVDTKKDNKGFNYMNILYGAILGAMAGVATYYIGITVKRMKSSK